VDDASHKRKMPEGAPEVKLSFFNEPGTPGSEVLRVRIQLRVIAYRFPGLSFRRCVEPESTALKSLDAGSKSGMTAKIH
jgi:hypothetical protein